MFQWWKLNFHRVDSLNSRRNYSWVHGYVFKNCKVIYRKQTDYQEMYPFPCGSDIPPHEDLHLLWPFGQRLNGLLKCTAILQQLGWSHKIGFNENVQLFWTPWRWFYKTGFINKVNMYLPQRVWGSWWRDRNGCVPRWGRHARRSSPSPPIGGTYPSPPASRCPADSGCYIYLQKMEKIVL